MQLSVPASFQREGAGKRDGGGGQLLVIWQKSNTLQR